MTCVAFLKQVTDLAAWVAVATLLCSAYQTDMSDVVGTSRYHLVARPF